MPIIPSPQYSKKNVQWSMYKIADSKWQPQPPAAEDLPKYKKYTKNWFSRKIINISDSISHRRSSAFVQQLPYEYEYEYEPAQREELLRRARIREQELEEARREQARLVWNQFQQLLALRRAQELERTCQW